jgi:hypothetical protein
MSSFSQRQCVRNNDMAKTHALSFRVEPELKSGLERAAQADRRSLSSLIEKILAEWMENYEATPARGAKPGGSGGSGSGQSAKPPGSAAPGEPVSSKEAQLQAMREGQL